MSGRPIAFVLASTDHGTLILNRNDVAERGGVRFGVGIELLTNGVYCPQEIDLGLTLLGLRRKAFGDGVVAIDCGANIGVHTIDWSRWMAGWGRVIAIEAQERIFYALAGNIAINNCFNAQALFAAVGREDGQISIPSLNYNEPASFGSLEIKQLRETEDIGQPIDYRPEHMTPVRALRLDSLGLARVDLIKIDVEGMEVEVLQGGMEVIKAHKPILLVEFHKTDRVALMSLLNDLQYIVYQTDNLNILALHAADPARAEVEAMIASRRA
jgi:FkbM family methyltransferase